MLYAVPCESGYEGELGSMTVEFDGATDGVTRGFGCMLGVVFMRVDFMVGDGATVGGWDRRANCDKGECDS